MKSLLGGPVKLRLNSFLGVPFIPGTFVFRVGLLLGCSGVTSKMQALWVLNLPHLPSSSVPGCSLSLGTWKRQLQAGKNDNTLVYLAGSKELKELLAAHFDPDKINT